MKNIKNKETEPHNNIYLGIHATVQTVRDVHPYVLTFLEVELGETW